MFDAENVNAILSANIQFANTFADPPGRNFYFKNGVLLVDLYVVENMVGSESDRRPFCHLLFRVDHVICAVAEQKLRLHIAFGAGYHAFCAQLFQQRGGFQRVLEAAAEGADFIKIMISGLMDFDRFGVLTEDGLPPETIRELIHIAHEEGFAVMAHANGARTVEAAALTGVDSVEHGAYLDTDALHAMRENGTVWVPTLSTIGNLRGTGRFDEAAVAAILESAMENVAAFAAMGGLIAPGTDAGAWAVPHGSLSEYALLKQALGENAENVLSRGVAEIQRKF